MKFIPLLPLLFIGALTACASSPSPRTDTNPFGTVRFDVAPPDLSHVEIFVDDHYYGELSKWRDGIVKLEAGPRRVTIQAPGYYTQRFDFLIKKDSHSTFTITLEPDVDSLDNDTPSRPDPARSTRPTQPLAPSLKPPTIVDPLL